ncbi:MAG: acyl-CoA thioesterase [Vicingaceae bacterium]
MESKERIYKPVSFSKTIMTELMLPTYANFGGKVHGGTILSLMDRIAYVCSSKHAGTYCVTVSVDTVDFISPVEVGNLVSLHASVNYVGKSSLIIGIKAVSEDLKDYKVRHTNRSYFTMVAVDEALNPTQVPGLVLENSEEVRRFIKAKIRKEFKRQKREELESVIAEIEASNDMTHLKGENCKLGGELSQP